MRPSYQTKDHPTGDCFRAAIASLLEMRTEDVPDFTALSDVPSEERPHYTEWYIELQRWLNKIGLQMIEVQLGQRAWVPIPNGVLVIFLGEHKTENRMHAIVGRCIDDLMEPVFDPAGGEELPFKEIDAVCFLVPIDPMLIAKPQKALRDIALTCRAIPNKIVADSIISTAREAMIDPAELLKL